MIVKPGASIALAVPQMQEAGDQIAACYAALGVPCIVTSGDERTTLHQGKPIVGDTDDPHYCGKAWDFRIWNVPERDREALVAAIRERLGPEYVVLWESRGLANEHLHVQHGHIATA